MQYLHISRLVTQQTLPCILHFIPGDIGRTVDLKKNQSRKSNITNCKKSQLWNSQCQILNGQRADLDTYQVSKIPTSSFLWYFRFHFPLQENNAKSLSCEHFFNSGIDIHGYCREPANYLKDEANCICSDLSLYSKLFFIIDC